MVLTKYFELFGISVSLSKSILIFKCDCLSGSNKLNLHLEIAFFKKKKKSRACKNVKIFCPSVLTIATLRGTKASKNFFNRVFQDATLKS